VRNGAGEIVDDELKWDVWPAYGLQFDALAR
jgi:hypothetical protein